jgi:hypothetical protein
MLTPFLGLNYLPNDGYREIASEWLLYVLSRLLSLMLRLAWFRSWASVFSDLAWSRAACKCRRAIRHGPFAPCVAGHVRGLAVIGLSGC